MENLDALTGRDEVKFVISDRDDYEFAREFTREHGLAERAGGGAVLAGIQEVAQPGADDEQLRSGPAACWWSGCWRMACPRG